jgi:hypothetical protein
MNKNTNSFLRWSVTAMIAAAPLCAQEGGWSKVNWGVQLGTLIPQGDLKEWGYGTGFGLAGYGERVFSNNWALRGRLEYAKYGDAEAYAFGSYFSGSMAQIGFMVDAIYYGLPNDLYLFGGAGYFYRAETWAFENYAGSEAENEAALSLGVGWNFTPHLGLEVKYTVANANWIQASVLYRF